MADPVNPTLGAFHIDGTEFEAYAEDLPPGGLQGFKTTHEGFLEAVQELVTAHPTHGSEAGIPDGDITDLKQINERIARIDVFLPAYAKATEVLTETRAKLDDRRERILLNAAKSVDRRAGQSPTLLAKYQRTREYRSAIAKKALKTKAMNAKQNDANGAGEPKNTASDAAASPPTA